MMKQLSVAMIALMLFSAGFAADMSSAEAKDKPTWKTSWKNKNVKYENFTDLGNYLVLLNDVDASVFEKVNDKLINRVNKFAGGCTATVKKNSKGQIIVGRNMDVEISQTPAYAVTVVGGKYKAAGLFYPGIHGKYRYDQLNELDKDKDYISEIPFLATDAMNEKGLYIEVNMREMDNDYNFYCTGTNPKAKKACISESVILGALNCATVEEFLEYLNNSYSWYTVGFEQPETPLEKSGTLMWNYALIVGDAKGNYGLIEFAKNKIYYTPYANGQGNYYIHPELNAYAVNGTGYGRLAAALKGLPKCETEYDMMDNMKSCMWKKEILNPGCLGYDDYENNINERRRLGAEKLQKGFEATIAPLQPKIKAYYSGDEKPLRDAGDIWTTGFNIGANCAKKHLVLRLWERDDVIFEYQW